MLVPNMMAKKNRMTFTMNVSQKMIFIWVDFPLPGRSIGYTDFPERSSNQSTDYQITIT